MAAAQRVQHAHQYIIGQISLGRRKNQVVMDQVLIMRLMESPGITPEDIDESISWLLQMNEIVEIERDVFIING